MPPADLPTLPTGIPLDASYGSGIFRRSIKLVTSAGAVMAELEDQFHAMRLMLRHDGEAITDVDAEMIRVPTTVCGGAVLAVRSVVGTPLNTPLNAFFSGGRARVQCTHIYDLVTLAVRHASHPISECRYDFAVTDAHEGCIEATAHLNARLMHRWTLNNGTFSAPEALAGRSVWKGLLPVLFEAYEADELEAAMALQKSIFVARARLLDFGARVGASITLNEPLQGQCFAYQPAHAALGTFIDSSRDFTDRPAELLEYRD